MRVVLAPFLSWVVSSKFRGWVVSANFQSESFWPLVVLAKV